MVAIWVAVHHRAAESRKDRPAASVQLEPIWTAATRAANAVGVGVMATRCALELGQRDELAEKRPGGWCVEPVVEAVRHTGLVGLQRDDSDEHVAAAGVEEDRAA